MKRPADKVIERCTKDEYSLFESRLRSNQDSNGEYESFVQSSIMHVNECESTFVFSVDKIVEKTGVSIPRFQALLLNATGKIDVPSLSQ